MKNRSVSKLFRILITILILGILARIVTANVSIKMTAQTPILSKAGDNLSEAISPGLDNPDELEAFIDGVMAVQMDTYHLAGAMVAVVRDGEILLAKGYGFSNVGSGIPVDPEVTLFRIGSISKLFTWTAVMQLAEQRVLDLDADINSYLDFEIPATFPEPITLKNLMTHTAGFEEMGFGLFAAGLDARISNGDWLKIHIPARVWAPGRLSAYSNYGAALAGYIVERQSGIPYEEYISQNILLPLGMRSSSAWQPLAAEMAAGMSHGYRFEGTNFVAKDFELVNAAPAGSISASATDMAYFMMAHLNGGKYGEGRILSEATTHTMHSRLWGADSRLNGWAYGFYELSQNGQRVIGHGGDTRLFHSLLALLPDENVGFFVSYNTETDSMAPQKLFELFMDRYYPETPIEQPTPPADTLAHAAQVAGSYRLNRAVYTRAGKIDSLLQPLMIQAGKDGTLTIPTPMGTMHFVEVAPYFYQQIGGDDKAVFWVNDAGQVTHSFINSFPMMAAERLPWYEAALLHLGLATLAVLLSLSTLIAAIAGFFIVRAQPERPKQPHLARVSRWVLGITSLMCLAFVTLYAISLGNPMLRLTGQRALLDVLSWIALLITLLAAGSIALAVNAWIKKYWRLSGRVHYSLVAIGMTIFAFLLIIYNQVGWQW